MRREVKTSSLAILPSRRKTLPRNTAINTAVNLQQGMEAKVGNMRNTPGLLRSLQINSRWLDAHVDLTLALGCPGWLLLALLTRTLNAGEWRVGLW
jgi:hypothetical protein